jgi:hypothetical protein
MHEMFPEVDGSQDISLEYKAIIKKERSLISYENYENEER